MSVTKPNQKKHCKFLRVKNPYGAFKSEDGAAVFDENIATCWCVKTQGPAGPDGGYVDPLHCKLGRKCYVEPTG